RSASGWTEHRYIRGDEIFGRIRIRFVVISNYDNCIIQWTRSVGGWTVNILNWFFLFDPEEFTNRLILDFHIFHVDFARFFRNINLVFKRRCESESLSHY
ncbi:hypothetical protein PMAYCL1PPCAC_27832, partial [Pristionchus mayeri]